MQKLTKIKALLIASPLFVASSLAQATTCVLGEDCELLADGSAAMYYVSRDADGDNFRCQVTSRIPNQAITFQVEHDGDFIFNPLNNVRALNEPLVFDIHGNYVQSNKGMIKIYQPGPDTVAGVVRCDRV